MYSKSPLIATGLLCLALAACMSMPWKDEPVGQEVNLAFIMQNNLPFLPSLKVDGRSGKFTFGSANARTVIDPKFARAGMNSVQFNERESVRMTGVNADLHGVADAIVGADVFEHHAVTIDYRSGLITYQKEGMHPELMSVFAFSEEPMVNMLIDGQSMSGIVDTASPDTIVLPRGDAKPQRRAAHVQIANADLGMIDVQLADVAKPRIGNRVLSKFLVTIDYGKKRVGLFRM